MTTLGDSDIATINFDSSRKPLNQHVNSFLSVFAATPDDGVHECRFAGFYLRDSAAYCRADFCRVFDRSLGVPADAFRDMREVGRRAFEIHANISTSGIGAALMRHMNLVRPVVVVGAIVVH